MNILCFLLAINFLSLASCKEDNVAAESGYSYRKSKPYALREEIERGKSNAEDFEIDVSSQTSQLPVRDHVKMKSLDVREREARGEHKTEEEILINDAVRGPIHVLPSGYDVSQEKRETSNYHERYKHGYRLIPVKENPGLEQKVISLNQNKQEESTQYVPYVSGSYLTHIKENMNNGKLLGFASFVEHFSENDDAEELKTAVREGSLDDIKKLVPKSGISFQMYHGEMDERPVKEKSEHYYLKEALNEVKPWGWSPWDTDEEEIQRHYVKANPHRTVVIEERKKRMRNRPEKPSVDDQNRHYAVYAEVEPKYKTPFSGKADASQKSKFNEVYSEQVNQQIIPSVIIDMPKQSHKIEGESHEKERQETQINYGSYGGGSEQTSWRPLGEKPIAEKHVALTAEHYHKVLPPKLPEASKLYFEHFKNIQPQKLARGETYHKMTLPIGLTERDILDRGIESKSPKTDGIVGDQKIPKFPSRYVQKFFDLKSTPERGTYEIIKEPIRIQPIPQVPSKKVTSPAIMTEEEFNRSFEQLPREPTRITSPGPTKYHLLPQYWAKHTEDETDHSRRSVKLEQQKKAKSPVMKLEKILNKQLSSQTGSNNGQEGKKQNKNIFLTKEFQNEISEFLNGGKSNFEWIPSTHINYGEIAYESSPTLYQIEPKEDSFSDATYLKSQRQSPRQLTFRSGSNLDNLALAPSNAKGVVFLGPETEQDRKEFFVSASYKIDKNRKSDKATH